MGLESKITVDDAKDMARESERKHHAVLTPTEQELQYIEECIQETASYGGRSVVLQGELYKPVKKALIKAGFDIEVVHENDHRDPNTYITWNERTTMALKSELTVKEARKLVRRADKAREKAEKNFAKKRTTTSSKERDLLRIQQEITDAATTGSGILPIPKDTPPSVQRALIAAGFAIKKTSETAPLLVNWYETPGSQSLSSPAEPTESLIKPDSSNRTVYTHPHYKDTPDISATTTLTNA